MARTLTSDERALWQKVVATVEPLHRLEARGKSLEAVQIEAAPDAVAPPRKRKANIQPSRSISQPAQVPAKPVPGTTLDATWDRRLGKGLVSPDVTVDLHGHNLANAYAMLDSKLEQAVSSGARLLLLITGKPPTGERWPIARGAIRAAVGDWLHASRHASAIAAVRAAHPRHGGTGALYIVLRRKR